MSNIELMNVFDFVLTNEFITISDESEFSRKTLIHIRNIVNGKEDNDFSLSEKQKHIIIEAFKNGVEPFNERTPNVLLEDAECILFAIQRDIHSLDYLNFIPESIQEIVLSKALKDNYILNENSPIIVCSDFNVAVNSVKLEKWSADYICWDAFKEDEVSKLIELILSSGYLLTAQSADFLRKNSQVAIATLKDDIDNARFVDRDLRFNNKEVFKFLLFGDYFDMSNLKSQKLSVFTDKEIMTEYFLTFDVWDEYTDEKVKDRFVQLFYDALNIKPKIEKMTDVFQFMLEKKWLKYKESHIDLYSNVFGKICASLKANCDYNEALEELKDLCNEMKKVLGNKYPLLEEAMEEYDDIYHSSSEDKMDKIQRPMNVISRLSALYVSRAKEEYKKRLRDDLYDTLKRFFKLDYTNPVVKKKVDEVKKKLKLKELYENKDEEVVRFVNNLVDEFSSYVPKEILTRMIEGFFRLERVNVGTFKLSPKKYGLYRDYLKVQQLVKRLNLGNINIDGPDVGKYKQYIGYDPNKEGNQPYFVLPMDFTKSDLEEIQEYKIWEDVFTKVKRKIMSYSGILYDDVLLPDEIALSLTGKFPFNDEYFVFDIEYALKMVRFEDLYSCLVDKNENFYDTTLFENDYLYRPFYKIVVENNLLWIVLLGKCVRLYQGFIPFNALVENMESLVEIASSLDMEPDTFANIYRINSIIENASSRDIAMLSLPIVERLCTDLEYTNENPKEIIENAVELFAMRAKRSSSTVPYLDGACGNYRYETYDPLDETLFLAGLDTDACFRVCGNDNDFFHYCALDKNGFVIKFTDSEGNFVARAGGFRNGNAVYFNQLRTIYDESGIGFEGKNESEKKEIIEAFKKACEEIVLVSQSNLREKDKIDFVFVTKSYSLDKCNATVSNSVKDVIGENPMDTESEDWNYFVDNVNNLDESDSDGYFYTDYDGYPILCIAGIKKAKELVPGDIVKGDVPALYERKREKIVSTDSLTLELKDKLNRIRAICSYLDDEFFEGVHPYSGATYYVGDNWYIAWKEGEMVESCLIEEDEYAKEEFRAMYEHLCNSQNTMPFVPKILQKLLKRY